MLETLLPIVAVVIVLVLVAAITASVRRGPADCPYIRADLFSPAERSFLSVLDQAVGGRFRILGKVRLADVIKVTPGHTASARQSAFNRIQGKHVDFVLCDPATLKVEYVIELDDKSHGQSKRQSRDEFVDRALAAAGICVVHVPAMRSYSVENIRKALVQS